MPDIGYTEPGHKSAPALTIASAITEDLPNGQPWPPDGNGFWSIVRRADGFTKWRRIISQEQDDLARVRADIDQQTGALLKFLRGSQDIAPNEK